MKTDGREEYDGNGGLARPEGVALATPEAPTADRLKRLVRDLDVRHGHERSIKALDGALLANRYLLSLHKDSLGPDPRAKLFGICDKLDMPELYREPIDTNLPAADIVHLGFEEGVTAPRYKLYLEFAARFKRSLEDARATGDPQLVYLAFKWEPTPPARHTVARYTCQPFLGPGGMVARLSKILAHRNDSIPFRVTARLLELAMERIPCEELFFMEVEEENNPRRSFDLNVYNASFTMHEVEPLLSQVWRYFRIPEARSRQLLESVRHETFGHVSGGIGRDGKEFFSVYFGVEPR
jgi:tryptophan halogenase